MKSFTDIYLDGLNRGIAKTAAGLLDFQPFAPENSAITGGAVGGLAGAAAGGVGNAVFGSKKEDPETGRKSNGILARLMKGGLVGGAVGAAGGALAGPTVNDAASGLISSNLSPVHTGVAQSTNVADLLNLALGGQPSPTRQTALGLEGLGRGAQDAAKRIFKR